MKRKKAYIAAAVTLLLFAWNNSQKTLLTDTGESRKRMALASRDRNYIFPSPTLQMTPPLNQAGA